MSVLETCNTPGCERLKGHGGRHRQSFDFHGHLELDADGRVYYVTEDKEYQVKSQLWTDCD